MDLQPLLILYQLNLVPTLKWLKPLNQIKIIIFVLALWSIYIYIYKYRTQQMYDDKSELARTFTVIWCLVPPFKIIHFFTFSRAHSISAFKYARDQTWHRSANFKIIDLHCVKSEWFSSTWSCGSRQRDTTSCGWKLQLNTLAIKGLKPHSFLFLRGVGYITDKCTINHKLFQSYQ